MSGKRFAVLVSGIRTNVSPGHVRLTVFLVSIKRDVVTWGAVGSKVEHVAPRTTNTTPIGENLSRTIKKET